MAVRLHEMTRVEQVAVLREALRLLAEPKNWCQENWKCEVYNHETGRTEFGPDGEPVYAYCLEGAINQATVNLYGELRARELGAWDEEEGICTESGRTPTETISLNDLVIEMYPTALEEWLARRPDDKSDWAAMFWQDQEGRTWEDVTGLIRSKLAQLGAAA